VIVYPAVDIRNGRCVQLTQGRADTEVVHHDDPAAQAALWTSLGAGAIHVVNLDGALAYGAGTASALNLQRVKEIRRTVDVPLQFAGGLRDERDVETAIGLDVDRIVIGTAAVVRPELVAWALRRWGPERVAVALEVKGGQVVTHGWQQSTPLTPVPFGGELYRMGVRTALYTDVDREGLLGGVDAAGAVALAEATGLRLVISGGVGGIGDIRALAAVGDAVEGVVIGQALYTGRLSLPEALAAAAA
jgi:phosphoribosylformimino-5-aminoimidazole carboxamide ribotide isomerase